jgi:hypothetical protein
MGNIVLSDMMAAGAGPWRSHGGEVAHPQPDAGIVLEGLVIQA